MAHRPGFESGSRNPRSDGWPSLRSVMEPLEPRHLLATVFWDGGPTGLGTNWFEAVNWQGDVLPGAADTAVLSVPANPAITFNGTATIAGLVCDEAITFTGGTLTLGAGATADINGTLTLNGATLSGGTWDFAGGAFVAGTHSYNRLLNFKSLTDLSVAGRLQIWGSTTFPNLRLRGPGAAGHAVGFSAGYVLTTNIIVEAPWYAPIGMAGFNGTFTVAPGATIRVSSGATSLIGLWGDWGGSMTLINQGQIIAEPGSNLTLVAATINNQATIDATDAALRLQGGWTNNGVINVTDADLELGGTFTRAGIGTIHRVGGTVTLAGTLNNAGGTLVLNAATGSWLFDDGVINGGAVAFADGQSLILGQGNPNVLNGVTYNAPLLLDLYGAHVEVTNGTTYQGARLSGENSSLYLGPGQAVTSSITVEGPAGGSRYVLATPLTATLLITGTGSITTTPDLGGGLVIGNYYNQEGNTLINQGLIRCDTPGRTLTLTGASLTNGGTIESAGGVLDLRPASWSSSGTIAVSNTTLELNGTFTTAGLGTINRAGGVVNLRGTLTNTGATLTLNAAIGSWVLLGGTITGGTLAFADGRTLEISTNGNNRLMNVGVLSDWTLGLADARLRLEGSTTFPRLSLAADGSAVGFSSGHTLTGEIVFAGTGPGDRRVEMLYGGAGAPLHVAATGVIRTAPEFVGTARVGSTTAFTGTGMTLNNAGLVDLLPPALEMVISAKTVNSGTIRADGSPMIIGGDFPVAPVHTGSFVLAGGALMTFSSRHDLAPSGSITGDGSASLSGSSNIAGTIDIAGDLSVVLAGTSTYSGPVTVGGTLFLDDGFSGSTTFSGVLTLGGLDIDISPLTLTFNGPTTVDSMLIVGGTLNGSGAITVTGSLEWQTGIMSGTGITSVAPGATLTMDGAAGRTLSRRLDQAGTTTWTSGVLFLSSGTFNNLAGAMFTAAAAANLSAGSGTNAFNNSGTFVRTGSGTTTVSAPFNTTGQVQVEGGTLALTGAGTRAGPFTIAPGGTLSLANTQTLQAAASVTGAGALTTGGTATLGGPVSLTGPVSVNGGTTTINGPFAAGALAIASGATALVNADASAASVTNSGTLNLGERTLTVAGAYTQATNGTLRLRFGAGAAGHVAAGGSATLAGALHITFAAGYTPPCFTSVNAVSSTGVTGTFTTFTSPGLPARGKTVRLYEPTGLRILFTTVADTNNDGALSINDFIQFQTLFALGSPLADLNGDGQLNINDFIAFQTLFAQGPY